VTVDFALKRDYLLPKLNYANINCKKKRQDLCVTVLRLLVNLHLLAGLGDVNRSATRTMAGVEK
jgi:hypothetical protein